MTQKTSKSGAKPKAAKSGARSGAKSKAAKPQRRTLLLVLGMHRSGTSALTRVLNLCGLELPGAVLEPQPDNERGFWEPKEVVEAHARFMAALDISFDALEFLPDGFQDRPEAADLELELVAALQSVPGRKPIIVKDPRTSLLIPIWKRIAKKLNYQLKIVVATRNPVEVARSLDVRNRFSVEKSYLLWLIYYLELERNTRDLPRVYVSFEGLLEDWRSTVLRISKSLSLKGVAPLDDVSGEVEAFLEDGLRRQRARPSDLLDDASILPWVKKLFTAHQVAVRGGAEPTDVVDGIYPEFVAALDALRLTIGSKDGIIYNVATQLEGRDARLREVEAARESLAGELEAARQAFDQERAALAARLAEEGANARAEGDADRTALQAERERLIAESAARQEAHAAEVSRLQAELDQASVALQAKLQAHESELAEATADRDRVSHQLDETKRAADEQLSALERARKAERDLAAAQLEAAAEELERVRQAADAERSTLEAGREADMKAAADEKAALAEELERVRQAADAERSTLEAAREADMKAAADEKAALAEELERVRQAAEAERSTLEAGRSADREAASAEKARLARELDEAKSATEKQVAALNEANKSHESKLEALRSSHGRELKQNQLAAETKLAALSRKLEAAEVRANEKQERLRVARSEISQKRAEIDDLRQAESRLASELEQSDEERQAAVDRAERLTARLEARSSEVEHLTLRLDRLTESHSLALASLSRVKSDFEASLDARADLVERAEALQASLEETRESARLEAAQVESLKSRLADAEQEASRVSVLTRQLETSSRRSDELSQKLDTASRHLHRDKSIRLKLVRGLMRLGAPGRTLALASGLYSMDLLRSPRSLIKALRQAGHVRRSTLFDAEYYTEANWDVRYSGAEPALHYVLHGAAEGRDPSAFFETRFYQARYPDVEKSGLNPLYHYLRYGEAERRLRSSNEAFSAPAQISGADTVPDRPALEEAAKRRRFFSVGSSGGEVPRTDDLVNRLRSHAPAWIRDMDPEVSIVIVASDRISHTLGCLDALSRHRASTFAEVILVTGSTSDEAKAGLDEIGWIRVVSHDAELGLPAAYDLGASAARANTLVMLQADFWPTDGWLDALVSALNETGAAPGLIGGKLIGVEGRLRHAGGVLFSDGSMMDYGMGQDPGRPQYSFAREVDYCFRSGFAMSRSLWRQVGVHTDRSSLSGPDFEVQTAMAVRAAGRVVWYAPHARLIDLCEHPAFEREDGRYARYAPCDNAAFVSRWTQELSTAPAPLTDPETAATWRSGRLALVVTADLPEPWSDAGSLTVMDAIAGLQLLGYQVALAPQDNMVFARRAAELLQARGVEVVYRPYFPELKAWVSKSCDRLKLVHFFGYETVKAEVDAIRVLAPAAVCTLNVKDLHHLRMSRELQQGLETAEKVKAVEQVRRDELAAISAVDAVFTHSTVELDLLSKAGWSPPAFMFPLVISRPDSVPGFTDRRDVMFIGGYRHPPNADAVLYFTKTIMPFMRSRVPEMVFHIAGSKAGEAIYALAGPNVVVDGHVEDLADYFSRFKIMVAPLRYGAGVKGKVATALAHGVPSVISSVAAEGMGLEDGKQVLIRDEPAQFADAVAALYCDQALWEHLSAQAREYAATHLSQEGAVEAFRSALQALRPDGSDPKSTAPCAGPSRL